MESEELIRRCRAIKLSDEEGGRVSFKSKMKDKGEKIVAGCLIGKVINTRGVSIEGLKMAMQRVWKTTREVKIESLGDNIFIFKFGSEADKRSILVGGPWHFDRALIVLIEPVGIGDVKKQDFSHTSFWVQIHDVPIMCMTKEMKPALGEAIGKVEEVETDAAGECFGQFLRLRISVDITRPLKKILELEQEGQAEEDIPMQVMYERLPDFCFCCGRIGHQYRECAHYKSQSKDELAYGPWLKASTITERLKQSRGKDRWDSAHNKPHTNSPTPPRNRNNSGVEEREKNKTDDPDCDEGSNRHLLDPGLDNSREATDQSQRVVGPHLMQGVTGCSELEAKRKEQNKAEIDGTVHRDVVTGAGIKGGKGKERETNTEGKKLEKPKPPGSQNAGDLKRGEKDQKGFIMNMGQQQIPCQNSTQIESEVEKIVNGPRMENTKPKQKKWKSQARNVEAKMEINEGPLKLKRPCSAIEWESPKTKRCKIISSTKPYLSPQLRKAKNIASKLNFESENGEGREELHHVNELAAVAVKQPRRQP